MHAARTNVFPFTKTTFTHYKHNQETITHLGDFFSLVIVDRATLRKLHRCSFTTSDFLVIKPGYPCKTTNLEYRNELTFSISPRFKSSYNSSSLSRSRSAHGIPAILGNHFAHPHLQKKNITPTPLHLIHHSAFTPSFPPPTNEPKRSLLRAPFQTLAFCHRKQKRTPPLPSEDQQTRHPKPMLCSAKAHALWSPPWLR